MGYQEDIKKPTGYHKGLLLDATGEGKYIKSLCLDSEDGVFLLVHEGIYMGISLGVTGLVWGG